MVKEIYRELREQTDHKIGKSEDLFNHFFRDYIINTIHHSDLLEVINSKNRDVSNIENIEYFTNEKVLLRAIKVLTMLELSKDFKSFQKLNKLLRADREVDTVEFDKILQEFLK